VGLMRNNRPNQKAKRKHKKMKRGKMRKPQTVLMPYESPIWIAPEHNPINITFLAESLNDN